MAGLFNKTPNALGLGGGLAPQRALRPRTLISAKGTSGTTYQLQIDPIGAAYQRLPGVYVFCFLAEDGEWKAVYIGETDNFFRRLTSELKSHHKWQSIREHRATHIGTLHVMGGLAERLNIETDLRRGIPTPCNDQ